MTAAPPAISEATTKASKKEPNILTRYFKDEGYAICVHDSKIKGKVYYTENSKFISIKAGEKPVISTECPIVRPKKCSIARAKREFKKSVRIAAGAPEKTIMPDSFNNDHDADKAYQAWSRGLFTSMGI